jgi:type VI secretion system protein ImpL
VNQLEALRPMLASLFSAQPDQAPAWDFVPVFRVNRAHEVNGNQIIDWSFAAGNTTFRNSDAPKIGHWSFGQPVTLTLRWAKDSPNRPVAETPANNFPETRTVIYEYHDPWALLRMLVEHGAPSSDFDRKVDPDPQTLAFMIAQQVVPQPPVKGRPLPLLPGNQTAGPDVKVFVSIRLYAPGKTTSLPLPVFPIRSPAP